MKKLIAVLFAFAAIFALTVTLVKFGAEKGRHNTRTSNASQSDVKTSEMEPLLRSPLRKISVKAQTDDNGSLFYTVQGENGITPASAIFTASMSRSKLPSAQNPHPSRSKADSARCTPRTPFNDSYIFVKIAPCEIVAFVV